MAPITGEDKLDFVINCLKNAEFKVDYHKTAEETGCANANKAQIKLKKIIDETGKYRMTAGKVEALDDIVPTTPVKARGRGRPKKADTEIDDATKPNAKKRKIAVEDKDLKEGAGENEDNEEDEA